MVMFMSDWTLQGRGSKKATSKKATSKKSKISSKKAVIPAGSCDLSQRIFNIMEKHKEVSIQ